MKNDNAPQPGKEISEDTAERAGQARVTALPGQRSHRRRWVAAAAVVVVAGGGVAAAKAGGAFGQANHPGGGGSQSAASTAAVTRRTLSSQTQVSATLGYAGTYTVRGQSSGTITWLPSAGQVIRQGQALYEVDNGTPVYLLYGNVPLWRTLSVGMTGADVSQLNHDLVALGHATSSELDPGWDYFGAATVGALQSLQADLGLTVTGTLPLGQAVFLPAAIRVTSVSAALGSSAGGPLFQASSTTQVVTIDLNTDQEGDVKAGDRVIITLPDGNTTSGTISSVGTVARSSSSGSVITVEVSLSSPKAAGGLDQAPVEVAITTGSVPDALVVPVDALVAQSGGMYAVEVTGSQGRYLVPVTLGLFDDAQGLVQVTGAGLSAGQRVVVPTP